MQEALAKIWADVLKLDRIGIRDNFFQLGGHSLLATRVVIQVRKRLNIDLPLHVLFEAPTVGELADRLAAASSHSHRADSLQYGRTDLFEEGTI